MERRREDPSAHRSELLGRCADARPSRGSPATTGIASGQVDSHDLAVEFDAGTKVLRGDAIVTSPQSTLFPSGLLGRHDRDRRRINRATPASTATITPVRAPRRAAIRHRVVVGAGHARSGVAHDHDDHDVDDHDHDGVRRRRRPRCPSHHDDDAAGRMTRVVAARRARRRGRRRPGRGLPAPATVRRRARSRPAGRARGRLPRGPEAGAIVGFVAGFGFDLFLETPLGLDALVVRDRRLRHRRARVGAVPLAALVAVVPRRGRRARGRAVLHRHRRARRRRRGEGRPGRRDDLATPRCTTRCSRRSCSSWSGACSGRDDRVRDAWSMR